MTFLDEILKSMRKAAGDMNEKGLPLPLLRDNKTGKGSYTLTMFWVSFNIAIITLVGKVTKVLGEVDYSNVLWLLGITGGFYMGRKFKKDGTQFELGDSVNHEEKEEEKDVKE